MMVPGLFLDRDGTINEEVDFLSSPHHVRILPHAAEAIREANALGFKVIVVSNQSGVARGIFTEKELAEVNAKVLELLERDGAHIDALYYCPNHPDGTVAPYNIDSDCRKPKTGMLMRGVKEFNIDLSRSFMVGDRATDIQAGNNAGATSILVLTGYGKEQLNRIREENVPVEHVAENLLDAVRYIKTLQFQKQ